MKRELFNVEIRPKVIEIPIGKRGIAFDRLDLDVALDEYKKRNGRPPRKGGRIYLEIQKVSTPIRTGRGPSIKSSEEDAFTSALERVRKSKQKN
jgi:hypothetical protein